VTPVIAIPVPVPATGSEVETFSGTASEGVVLRHVSAENVAKLIRELYCDRLVDSPEHERTWRCDARLLPQSS